MGVKSEAGIGGQIYPELSFLVGLMAIAALAKKKKHSITQGILLFYEQCAGPVNLRNP